ncbi:MAG TPA: radical SAM protein [bacterium]|nr:radical SAM protein [bacterium]
MVEPTNFCNAQCPTCPTGSGRLKRPRGFMSETLFAQLVDECSPHGTKFTLWNFGEPFLHPQIFEFIERAHTSGISVKVSTNGTAFYTRRKIDRLLECGVEKVIIGIDGATPETHAKFRRGVDFAAILAGLSYLSTSMNGTSLPFQLVIQMLAFRHNESEIDRVRDLAISFGASFELKTANLQMVEGLDYEDWLPITEKYKRYHWNPERKGWYLKDAGRSFCSYIENGFAGFVVNWDGRATPCCRDYQSEWVIGDLNHQRLEEIWLGDPLNELRGAIRQDYRSVSICRQCAVDINKRPLETAPTGRLEAKRDVR